MIVKEKIRLRGYQHRFLVKDITVCQQCGCVFVPKNKKKQFCGECAAERKRAYDRKYQAKRRALDQ